MDANELEEALSRPTSAAIEAIADCEGDVIVLGAGGKMGPSLARMAQRALDHLAAAERDQSTGQAPDRAPANRSVIAVARYSRPGVRETLENVGVRTVVCDLLNRDAVDGLPDAGALYFMASTKFGTTSNAAATWALNAWVPGIVAERYRGVPTVVFSSGNVYPLVSVDGGGCTEDTPPQPVGEYAQSVLARERIFEHFAASGTPTTIYRLNYAAELRYGVPVDIARKVHSGTPIDLAMGHFNTIWQGDANAMALACLGCVATRPRIFNVTGPQVVSVRQLASRFGELFGRPPEFIGSEAPTALLSDSSRAIQRFGAPTVSLDQLTRWIADWIMADGVSLDAPTHYEVRDGAF